MSNASELLARLIDALYGSLAHEDWSSNVLAEVCAATNSQSGAVVVADHLHRRDRLPSFFGASGASALAYEALYSPMNPWRQPAKTPRNAGDVIIADDVVSLTSLRQTQFWKDFLHPMDVDHAAGIVGVATAKSSVSLTLLRSARRGRYGRPEEALMRSLASHWANACAIRARFSLLHEHNQTMEHAMDRVATAVIIVDGQGKVLQTNVAATGMLSRGTFLRLKDGFIRTVVSTFDSRLQKAIALAALNPDEAVSTPAVFIALPDLTQLHSALVAVHVTQPRVNAAEARAVLFVSEPSGIQHPNLTDALSDLYRLTKAEIALCHALLDEHDFRDAGESIGLRRSTARSRLQVIFAKTATNSQVELVLLLVRLRSLVG